MKRNILNFVYAASVFVFGVGASVSGEVQAQETAPAAPASSLEVAQKFDEFGLVGHCDFTARLDNFAVSLQNDPQLRGYLVTYGGRTHVEAVAQRLLEYMQSYLVNSRGVDPERFTLINGGVQAGEEVRNELWLAPVGVPPPVPVPLSAEETAKPIYGKLHEYETQDALYSGGGGEGLLSFSLPNFAGRLKKQPDSRGYIVVYEGADSNPGAGHRVAKREVQLLQGFDLDAKRYSVLNADVGEALKVELWVVARDAPPPVAEAKVKQIGKEAFNLGSFTDYDLRDADGEKWARDGLADMLRANPRVRGCLILHPAGTTTVAGDEPQVEVADEASHGQVAEAEQPVDLPRLVERWRAELAKEFGIGQDRLIILVGSSNTYDGSTLNTWIVPEDAALPDPFASEDEAETEHSDDPAPSEQTTGGKEQSPPPPPTVIRELRRFLF